MQVHVSETRRKGGPNLRWINIWGENDDKMKYAIIRNGLDSAMSNTYTCIYPSNLRYARRGENSYCIYRVISEQKLVGE